MLHCLYVMPKFLITAGDLTANTTGSLERILSHFTTLVIVMLKQLYDYLSDCEC